MRIVGRVLEALAVCAFLYAALFAWSMSDSPHLYAAGWYAKGGAPRTVQVIVTDVLGPRGVIALACIAALVYARPLSLLSRLRKISRRTVSLLVPIGLLLAIVAFADRHSPVARAAPNAPRMNVLVLAADSLRADRIDARIAPHLVGLSKRGTRFDKAFVSMPSTLPSRVTLLTGRHAHHHGIRSMFPTTEERAKDFDALPARFARAGYATGVVSDSSRDIFGRINLGFSRERSAAADPRLLAEDVERSLGSVADQPFFLTVFLSTAHSPYVAPSPYYAKYTDPNYRGASSTESRTA